MLVLSRKMDEQIVIGDDIRITVLRVKGDRVKLGIQAGAELKIMRAELIDFPDEPAVEPQSMIADPTAGLVDDDTSNESSGDTTAHPVDPCSNGPIRPNTLPNWLTICCCS